MHNMTRQKSLHLLLSVLILLLVFSCEERSHTNPYDSQTEVDPSDWAPTNLTATALSDSKIQLDWIDNCDFEEGYRVEQSEGGGAWTVRANIAADATTFLDSGLVWSPIYTYRVSAYTPNNQSGFAISNATSTIFPEPTNITATVLNDSEILLEWTDNCNFEEGFSIERQDDGSWEQIAELTADITQHTDTGLNTAINNYDYRIYAYTANNMSAYSNTARAVIIMTDYDGNTYQAVKIGSQWWMAENLKVTHYRNGDAIPNVTDMFEWQGFSVGAYCGYHNDANNEVTTYGCLYTWNAVNDSRNIAPVGWHVPSADEWQTVVGYLGGDVIAGGKMKETGTTHWTDPNTGATNESRFTALPGGCRGDDGDFYYLSNYAYFWSSTESNNGEAWFRTLNYSDSEITATYTVKTYGHSVRCVRD